MTIVTEAPVSFMDLRAEWAPLVAPTLARLKRVLEHGQFILGPEVHELEARLAIDIDVRHAISCASGTTALLMALMALDIQAGDEVILPAYTFAAPLEAILLLGARPVLADIEETSCNLDPESVATLIGPRTRAIIAVSLYGLPADFTSLNALAAEHGIPVIEDAAQSYGAMLNGRRSGALGRIGCTSFYPTKTLGGAGDGGAVFTSDEELALRLRQIRDHGQSAKYQHQRLGLNGRLDSLACAAILVRLDVLEAALVRRREIAAEYDARFSAQTAIKTPPRPAGACHAYGQYVVRMNRRDAAAAAMRAAGIEVAVHYPMALHQQPAFRDKVRRGLLEQAERAAQETLCLPIHAGLTLAQQTRVADQLIRFCGP